MSRSPELSFWDPEHYAPPPPISEEQFRRNVRDYVKRQRITNLDDDVITDLYSIVKEGVLYRSLQKRLGTSEAQRDSKARSHLIRTFSGRVDYCLKVLASYEDRRLPLTNVLVMPLSREFQHLKEVLSRAASEHGVELMFGKFLKKSAYPGELSRRINDYLSVWVPEIPLQEKRNIVIAACLGAGLYPQGGPEDLSSRIPMELSRSHKNDADGEGRVVYKRTSRKGSKSV